MYVYMCVYTHTDIYISQYIYITQGTLVAPQNNKHCMTIQPKYDP